MGETITKPDANPILLAILNLILCGIPVGYFMIGQSKKAIFALIYTWVLSMFGGIGFVLCWVWAYDVYLLGQKLAAGESISDTENGLEFLNILPGFK
jgi:hypothetical protein